MFKKFLLVFVVAVSALLLVACGERTYAADGVYTAFAWEIHRDGPQISSVSVTIENDKVKSFFIDCVQNTKTETNKGTEEAPEMVVSYAFNAKTKKELKYDYRMHDPARTKSEEDYKAFLKAEGLLEWFEQAELIEAFFLEKGPEALTVDEGNVITNVEGGVTIVDGGYSKLAKEALKLAKEGKAQAYAIHNGTDVVFATAEVDKKGNFTSLKLDTIQGSVNEGKFVWKTKTKQELKYDYRMHDGARTKSDEEYKTFLKEEGLLEWFEQADIITEAVLKNGVDSMVLDGQKLDSSEGKPFAGVTINAGGYKEALTKLYKNFK